MSRHRAHREPLSVAAAHIAVAAIITAAAVLGIAVVYALRVGLLAVVVM